ncbi:MAG: D-Ala-D-Ala carboxypeptidase family metallohydrolase [Xenococcaceae cyanobacterium]
MSILENWKDEKDITELDRAVVIEIQKALLNAGYYKGEIDGIVGNKTKSAFSKFKEDNYLEHPLILGEMTAKNLLEALEKNTHPISSDNDEPILFLPENKIVRLNQSILTNGSFTWAEATKNGTRIPPTTQVVNNIIRAAQMMEVIREHLGNKPIKVTSWFRPSAVNRAVGGASNSRHLVGDAVDFSVKGMPPMTVYNALNPIWKGGLASSARGGFTHADNRPYRARWSYGG